MDESLQGLVGDLLSEQSAKYKTTDVHKNVESRVDLGCLALYDLDPVTLAKFPVPSTFGIPTKWPCSEPGKLNDRLRNLARDNCQLLLNKVWELPASRVGGELCVKLPRPSTRLPREKPVPKKRPPTKWEEFRKAKGLANRKKTGKVWDEESQSWKARYGYKRAGDNTKDWLIEVPGGADPMKDYYGERITAKKERVAKNELQRVRNLAKAQKAAQGSVHSGVAGLDPKTKDAEQIAGEIGRARKATASVGKFTTTVAKGEKGPKNRGQKRHFEPNEKAGPGEKAAALEVLGKLQKKTPILNVGKAVGLEQARKERESAEGNDEEGRSGRKGRGGKKKAKRSAAGAAPRKRTAAGQKMSKGKGRAAVKKGGLGGGPKRGRAGKGKN